MISSVNPKQVQKPIPNFVTDVRHSCMCPTINMMLLSFTGLSNEEVNIGVQRGTCRLEASESSPPTLLRLMELCFEERAKNRPSFLQIIECLKNEARPEFADNSFFHSKTGQIARGLCGMDKV